MSALARHSDPDESHIAAATCKATELEAVVLKELKRGPATMHDVAARTGISLVSVSPRFAQLRRKGFLKDSGLRDYSATNKPRTIWCLS